MLSAGTNRRTLRRRPAAVFGTRPTCLRPPRYSATLLYRHEALDNLLERCVFSPQGGLIATTSRSDSIKLWDVRLGRPLSDLRLSPERRPQSFYGCAFSPDGRLLAGTTTAGLVQLWELNGDMATALRTLTGHELLVRRCAFSPDGRLLASASQDGTATIWRCSDGQLIHRVDHGAALHCCAFSPGGSLLATGGRNGWLKLWSVAEGRQVTELGSGESWIWECSFSRDGSALAIVSSNGGRELWRIGDARLLAAQQGQGGLVTDCSFSPDGALIAHSADMDGAIHLHRTAGDERVGLISGPDIITFSFSPDGRLIAAGDWLGGLQLWSLKS